METNPFLKPAQVWEDLVLDFLEMACFLTKAEQDFLVQEILQEGIQADNIDVHPCFSINGKVIIVCESTEAKECWLYYVRKKKIEKWNGAEDPQARG